MVYISKNPGHRANGEPGPESTTAEAAMNPQIHYQAKGCGTQEEKSHDLPQLPNILQAVRKAQKRPTA
ncbi:MAG: hypothetical protein WCC73_00820, partial [Terracidiphilus sp.]